MTNPSQRYLVRFKPLHSYYFGGERGFGFGEKQNYLVRSRRWPQQTTLLGAMRYLLLHQQGLLAAPGQAVSAQAIPLIGPQSFDLDDLASTMDFGKIQRLSPIFLMDGETPFLPAPLSHAKPLVADASAQIWYGAGKPQPAYQLQGYQAKKGLTAQLMATKSHAVDQDENPIYESLAEDSIFRPVDRVGIEKGRNGQPRTEAFYKQTSYTFYQRDPADPSAEAHTPKARDWSFACYLTVDAALKLPERVQLPLGGEKRSFLLTFEPADEASPALQLPDAAASPGEHAQWVLLSDALVEASIYDHCHFAVVEKEDFRFLRTSVAQTTRYANLGQEAQTTDTRKSLHKYTLLRRGSVLYPQDEAQVRLHLDQPRLQQIGYNHYQPLNPTQQ